jgi:hypothetical protein
VGASFRAATVRTATALGMPAGEPSRRGQWGIILSPVVLHVLQTTAARLCVEAPGYLLSLFYPAEIAARQTAMGWTGEQNVSRSARHLGICLCGPAAPSNAIAHRLSGVATDSKAGPGVYGMCKRAQLAEGAHPAGARGHWALALPPGTSG